MYSIQREAYMVKKKKKKKDFLFCIFVGFFLLNITQNK